MKKLSLLLGLCFLISSTTFAQLIDLEWPYCNNCMTLTPSGQEYEVSVLESAITTMLENKGVSNVYVVVEKDTKGIASATINTKIVAYNRYMLTVLSKNGNVVYSGHFLL